MLARPGHYAAPRSAEPEPSPSHALFTDLVLEVFRFNGGLIASGNRLCRGTGLTAARWQTLGAIALTGRPLTVAQIARVMGLTRQSVQRVVDELERAGVVRRLAHPEHRRARLVKLTDKGESAYAQVMRRQGPWAKRAAAHVSRSELETALRVVRALRERIEAEEPSH